MIEIPKSTRDFMNQWNNNKEASKEVYKRDPRIAKFLADFQSKFENICTVHGKSYQDERMMAYFESFKDKGFTTSQILSAMDSIVPKTRFFPSPMEILEELNNRFPRKNTQEVAYRCDRQPSCNGTGAVFDDDGNMFRCKCSNGIKKYAEIIPHMTSQL